MTSKDRYTIGFALIAASIPALHFFIKFMDKGRTLTGSISSAGLVFLVVVAFILAAYYSGGRKWQRGDILVSPWFGVFIAGSFLLFWMGGIYADDLYFGGIITVGLWGIVVILLRAALNYFKRIRVTE